MSMEDREEKVSGVSYALSVVLVALTITGWFSEFVFRKDFEFEMLIPVGLAAIALAVLGTRRPA